MTDSKQHRVRPDRAELRAALRRRVNGSAVLQRVVKRTANDRPQLERLLAMYQALRVRYTELPAGDPEPRDIAHVEQAALDARQQDIFLRSVLRHGDIGRAGMALVTELVSSGAAGRARTVAQAFQLQDGLTHVGDAAVAKLALLEGDASGAWELLHRHDPASVVPLAPTTFFRAAFAQAPDTARQMLEAVRAGAPVIEADAALWLEIARLAFVTGAEEEADWCLSRADRGLDALRNPQRRAAVTAEIAWLRPWLGRAAAARAVAPPPASQIPFAVIDYKQPDRSHASVNLGDPVQTLASLGHLVRRTELSFAGDGDLVGFLDELRARVAPTRAVSGPAATLRLYELDRDASEYSAVPQGTWMIAFGWLMHSMFGMRFGLPFNPALRPILVSVHLDDPAVLTPEAIDYLRRYGPVGCRDWNTVLLLRAADVACFFSGCITSTIDTVFAPRDASAAPSGTLYVDTPATGPGDTFEQAFEAVRRRSLTVNLRDAATRVQGYRDRYAEVVSSRLHCYLPARAIGANVEFRPKNPANIRFDGLAGITDDAFLEMRHAILDKLDAVLTAITAGRGEDEVYAIWREVCAPDVAFAEKRAHSVAEIPPPTMDVAAAVRTVRAQAVLIERSDVVAGREIHVEFSLDGNLKHQLAVVLDSIVSQTARPVRAHILCRDHDARDFDRLAELFPTVSFEWLPTDHVDYGPIADMIGHITVATMDRLLLPDLLPDVERIVHHDLDALCLTDLGELYDVDLQGHPLAARTSPQPQFRSGFREFIRVAVRQKADPALAREIVARTHTRHAFDFLTFNAGVLVLDLARMRADNFVRDFLPYVERFGLNDQAVLNAYAGADRCELAPAWNWNPRLERDDADLHTEAKIAHWAGPFKPWSGPWVNGKPLWQQAEARLSERTGRTTSATARAR